MNNNEISFCKPMNLTALVTQCNSQALNLDPKGTYARILIRLLLPEDCHKFKNLPYICPTDFCYIYYACMNLHKKSKENHIYSQNQTDEPYNKVHLFFLRCKQDKWNNINYFDMSDAFALILSANSTLPEHLRMHLENMHELCAGLDRLEYRYYSSLSVLFPKSSVIEFKKNILLSLCSPNKKKFFIEKKMDAKITRIYKLLKNPYEF